MQKAYNFFPYHEGVVHKALKVKVVACYLDFKHEFWTKKKQRLDSIIESIWDQ